MRLSFFTLILSLSILCLLVWRVFGFLPDGRLHVYILDVGQGDSAFLVSPSGKQILVDGGPDLSTLEWLGRRMSFFDRRIDLLVLTHPDQDHITAIPEILQRYDVSHLLLGGVQKSSARYESMLSKLVRLGIPVLLPDPNKDIDMGDGLVLDVVWPDTSIFGTKPAKANNTSVVIRAVSKGGTILLAGDIEKETEYAILRSGRDIRSHTLKIPHHGSRTSSSTGFILAINPGEALLSVGQNNRFGHPHKEIVDRYDSLHIDTRSTARHGTIALTF